jgi:hypothetical protein
MILSKWKQVKNGAFFGSDKSLMTFDVTCMIIIKIDEEEFSSNLFFQVLDEVQ